MLSKFKSKLTGQGVDVKVAVLTGAAANTNIALAGLTPDAQLSGVVMYAAGVPSDVTADASVVAGGGNIKLATTNSTGNKLVVTYCQPAS